VKSVLWRLVGWLLRLTCYNLEMTPSCFAYLYNNILVIKIVLQCFGLLYVLKVNFHKTQVGAIGVDDDIMTILSKCLNCRRMSLPLTYLGMNTGGNPRRVILWKPTIEKLSRKKRYLCLLVRCAS